MNISELAQQQRLANISSRGTAGAPPAQDTHELRVRARTDLPDKYVGMNKTERRRAEYLEAMRVQGNIAQWWYESWTFKLAHDTRYTPDFVILENDGRLKVEEAKGTFFRDDAKVKVKLFARLFPMPITIVRPRKSGGWDIEPVHP